MSPGVWVWESWAGWMGFLGAEDEDGRVCYRQCSVCQAMSLSYTRSIHWQFEIPWQYAGREVDGFLGTWRFLGRIARGGSEDGGFLWVC